MQTVVMLHHFTSHGWYLQAAFVTNVLLPGKWDVCITSFEICIRERAALRKMAWKYLVVDEVRGRITETT
jgi:hypothetical protein